MASINITLEEDVDIDVEEFFDQMDEEEKKEMLSLLIGSPTKVSNGDDEKFDEEVGKLIGNRWRLSVEDEETIMRIANKIVV
jgi:hypothetical protein